MATLETRDFLGMLDHPHYSSSSSSSSSSASPALQVSLRATEYSDSSINAERVPEGGGSTTDCSATYKRKRSAEQTVMHGGNGYCYPALHLLMVAPLLRNSVTPRRIPIARKASLARFFQMRNHRVQKLRSDGHNSSVMNPAINRPHCPTLRLDGHNDQSAAFMVAESGRKNNAIPSHTEIELIYSPSVNIMP